MGTLVSGKIRIVRAPLHLVTGPAQQQVPKNSDGRGRLLSSGVGDMELFWGQRQLWQ